MFWLTSGISVNLGLEVKFNLIQLFYFIYSLVKEGLCHIVPFHNPHIGLSQRCKVPKIQPTGTCPIDVNFDNIRQKHNEGVAIFKLSTDDNPYIDSLFGVIYEC